MLAVALGLALVAPSTAHAVKGSVAGYLRVMTRPDFQGGDGRLGYWNLYGRLLNEGPWSALELRLELLEREAGDSDVWALVHGKLEGAPYQLGSDEPGGLKDFRVSQLYSQVGNVLLPNVTWQIGTLDLWWGDMGLYDMRPSTLFNGTLGMSARYQRDDLDVVVGLGDSGQRRKSSGYNTMLTAGGSVRYRPIKWLEFGVGGEFVYEPEVQGNTQAPHDTPVDSYEDFVRGEVAQSWLESHPGQELNFPDPVPTDASSWKLVGYLGFGDLGPLKWNSTYVTWERMHPESLSTESFQGQDFTIYSNGLTDSRDVLFVGNEMQLELWPDRLDAVWSGLWARHRDADNGILPTDHARTYASTVLRLQTYVTPQFHVLLESSVAREHSTNGNSYRNHADSIFANTAGLSDSRGLETGDDDTRTTWQGKGGIVLNPLGRGVYVRPSLRILYGAQFSTQNNAFGNSFVETVDQFNAFGNVERHWHHVFALEAEAWF